jgi:protoporphyrinogen oxidase
MSARVVVIGGGIGGATAALRLRQSGIEVVLLETGPALGGLVVSFAVESTPLECFYHHVFPHERDIAELIEELGLSHRLDWLRSSVGIFTEGRVWPFTTATDLLRFGPLSVRDRFRAGAGALRLGRVRDWERLDRVRARDWLASLTGPRATEIVWDPLLAQKFGAAAGEVPAAWMWARFQQRAGARGSRRGGERLGYLRGGFRQLFEALDARLRQLGADVRTRTPVGRVLIDDGSAAGVELASGERVGADAVLYCGQLPAISRLVPASLADPRWSAIGGLGALCVVVELSRPLQSLYWVNVCDAELPFGGIIEHTNLVPAADYGGRHIVYLSRYFTADEALALVDPRAEAQRWVDLLADRFPSFDRSQLLAVNAFRTPYAAPLVHRGYLRAIPPRRSHIPGLYLSTTAHIYPQDRGMSDGVRLGTQAAGEIARDLQRVTPSRPGTSDVGQLTA